MSASPFPARPVDTVRPARARGRRDEDAAFFFPAQAADPAAGGHRRDDIRRGRPDVPEARERGGGCMTTRLWLTGAWLLSMAVPAVLLPCSARAETPAEQRIRRLEETLRRTQEELEALKNEVKQQKAIGQASQKQVEQATEAAEAAKAASAETAKKTVSLPDWICRTDEMFLDEDLSPEGFAQTFQLLEKPVGSLDQVKLHVLEWTFNEIANKEDGWMFGGQVNPTLHVGSVGFEAGVGQYWWLNPDQIAQAESRNTTAFP